MKSLEILDDIRLDLERYLDYLENDLQERIKNNESEISINEVSDLKVILVINMYDGIETIKQYLEVLEIIRKKKVDILALECRINTFKDDNERILHSYNAMFYNKKIYKLTMEELLKLKQWLEVNENE